MEADVKWAKVKSHCEAEIVRLHNLLESIQPDATTNQLRGEIRAIRRVLELGKPRAPEPPERMIQPSDPTNFA